jgi:hypothetical protein
VSEHNTALDSLARAARRTTRRLVVGRLIASTARWLPLPLCAALLTLTVIKVAHLGEGAVAWLYGAALACALLPLAIALRVVLGPRPEFWGAQVLDRHHDLKGRVANALAFSKEVKPDPLMQAAIADAVVHAQELRPREAVPLRVPPELAVSVGLIAALLLVSKLEFQTQRFIPQPSVGIVPLELSQDDLSLLKQNAELLAKHTEEPEVQAATRRFNQLIEDIANRRLDRQEVFRRLEQIEQGLRAQSEAEREGLEEGLQGLAAELAKNSLTKPAAEALEQKRLDDAEAALKALAERLRQRPGSVNKAELERLRTALQNAAKQAGERSQRIEEQRQKVAAERRRLLDKKQAEPNKPLSKQDQQELEQRERQLKRLDRQKQSAQSGAQQLSELDRQLAKAAQDLMKELGDAAKDLEQGAQELNRVAQKQLSDVEKEALKKQLEELRQMLRQNQGNSEERTKMLERFSKRARGQQGEGQPGQGQRGQGQRGQGKAGQGGAEGEDGQGQPGAGKGNLKLTLGQGNGPSIPLPMPGQGQPGQGDKGGQAGGAQGGTDVGNTTDGNLKGAASQVDGRAHDVAAAGIDSGQGEAASEVVYGAAERGFSSNGYKKVYTDYKTVAEEVMQSDEIPPGYRFYVRRYFQLIRPRE